jgi:hypothetical protein
MATNTKATAKRSRQTKTTTTAKGAGVKTRKTKVTTAPTLAQVTKAYDTAIATAKARGVKPPYRPSKAFLSAIVRAWSVPTLSEAGLTTGKGHAQARRDHARTNKAGKVTADMVVHENHKTATEGIGVFTDRPENTVRERLRGFCRVMGMPEATLYAVRTDKWQAGEVVGVYIVRQ